jgi:hypothetical protein
MNSRTSWAGNCLIHPVVIGLFFVRPIVLDVKAGLRTSKYEVAHQPMIGERNRTNIDGYQYCDAMLFPDQDPNQDPSEAAPDRNHAHRQRYSVVDID